MQASLGFATQRVALLCASRGDRWLLRRCSLFPSESKPNQAPPYRPMDRTNLPDNPFSRIIRRYDGWPDALRRAMVSWSVGRAIPMVGRAGLEITCLRGTRVEARLGNHSGVQNHIGGIHAAAIALLAETVTGLVVAINVPAGRVPLLRTLNVSYQRRTEAPLEATAVLSEEDASRIQTAPVGKIDVRVALRDATGEPPVACQLQWAWLPERRFYQTAS